jgi:hypothetical protein
MTVRGGGVPCEPWLSCRFLEWVRRLGASLPMRNTASWVWGLRILTEYKAAARSFVPRHAGLPSYRHPDAPSMPSCSKPSRPSLRWAVEGGPALTASARDGFNALRVGARESLRRGQTREMDRRARECTLRLSGPLRQVHSILWPCPLDKPGPHTSFPPAPPTRSE